MKRNWEIKILPESKCKNLQQNFSKYYPEANTNNNISKLGFIPEMKVWFSSQKSGMQGKGSKSVKTGHRIKEKKTSYIKDAGKESDNIPYH